MLDSKMPHNIQLVECQSLGPILLLSRSDCIMLDTSVDLSGTQLHIHKKGFVWLSDLQERSSSTFHDRGTGHGFYQPVLLWTLAPHVFQTGCGLSNLGNLVLASWILNSQGVTLLTSKTESSRQAQHCLYLSLYSAARQDQKYTSFNVYVRL